MTSSLVGLAAGTVLEGATIALLTQAGGISRTNVRAPGVERRGFATIYPAHFCGESLDDANAVDGLDWYYKLGTAVHEERYIQARTHRLQAQGKHQFNLLLPVDARWFVPSIQSKF